MSAHSRPFIVALILTIFVFPILWANGHLRGHGHRQGATYTLRCVVGKPIPATPLAKRIGVAGHTCHHVITRFVVLPKQPK